ncbi:hypothetical protein BJ170DRAFT_491279 [Xylariales sp. AK1849]|nr:hypothetical protein BJ170DRAFT_491279 [Xylariales sp. AK1849]
MAPQVDLRLSHATGTNIAKRGFLSMLWGTIDRILWRNSYPASKPSTLHPRNATVARSTHSPGAIAGIVVGSVIAGVLVLLVLGFLYFRLRRSRLVEDFKAPDTHHHIHHRRLSFPGPGPGQGLAQPGQSRTSQVQYTSVTKDGRTDHGFPPPSGGSNFQQFSTTANGDMSVSSINRFNPPQQQDFNQNLDYPSGHQISSSYPDGAEVPSEYPGTLSAVPSAAASYYNLDINMDSDPELGPMQPPSRQMTELYQEQLRQSRENRKNSKSSTLSRMMGKFKRKHSTHSSEITPGEASPSFTLQDVPVASVEGPDARDSERGGTWQPSPLSSVPATSQIYEEPQDMSDETQGDQHMKKRPKRHGRSGDASGAVAHRLDSLRADSDLDPQLPSTALRQGPSLPDTSPTRQATRFRSPDIPEPMQTNANGLASENRPAPVRAKLSPRLSSGTFVTPMDIMKPSNAAEKAAYNDAELVRIASTSVSPPTSPPNTTSPRHISQFQDNHVAYEDGDDEGGEDESAGYSENSESGDESSEPVGVPPVEEPVSSDGPSANSTPARQSSTIPSSERTPDTTITPSPSPAAPNGYLKTEDSLSPPESAASPRPHLTCEECGRTFDQIHKLNHHKRYHDRKHACTYPHCDKKFGTKTHLDRHINDKHEKKKGFHCTEDGCQYFRGGKAFPRKDNWRRHMLNKHGINATFEPELVECAAT